MKNTLFAFWTYSQFPYVLGDEGYYEHEGTVIRVPSYQFGFSPEKLVLITTIEEGKKIAARLDALREGLRKDTETLQSNYMDMAIEAMPVLQTLNVYK